MDFRVGPWLVRPDMDSIIRDGQSSHISPKAMEVLVCLARRQGQVVAKDNIFREVWEGTFVSDDSLTRCIGELRRAFQDDAREPSIIRTIAKRGYLLALAVTWEDGVPGAPPAPPPKMPTGRWWLAGIAFVLAVAAVWAWQWNLRAVAPAAVHRIAVLPLVNLSGDPQQEYFADGMTELLITELAQINAWEVISRTSVMRYKGAKQPLRLIARELGADLVVEGTVLRSRPKVRITAQLITAASDVHRWSGSFEREMEDVVWLQRSIARAIATELRVALTPREHARLNRAETVVTEAYESYLKGWYLFNHAQYASAASSFEQASIADPGFALAHALLWEADTMATVSQDGPPSERALRAIARARELDDTLAETHTGLGDMKFFGQWEWTEGEAEFRRAVELNPASVDAAEHFGYCLQILRKWDAAERETRRALHLDPVSPRVQFDLLWLFVNTHRYEAAVNQFQKAIELDPGYARFYETAAQAYLGMAREADAVACLLKADGLQGGGAGRMQALQTAARAGGVRGYWRKRLELLQDDAKRHPVPARQFATLYARLGDNDKALEFLEAAYRQRVPMLAWINASSVWDPLRSDPRFHALIRRMQFPE